MIHPHEITIGSLLRTSKGEIIRVESISTKRQHRKVGYHTSDDPRIKYVRLAQCEGIELTQETFLANEFKLIEGYMFVIGSEHPYFYIEYLKEIKKIRICADKYLCGFNVSKEIDFFHQLQFALICAGLHELAINLKVE